MAGPPFDREAFEPAVIVVDVMVLRGDLSAILAVVDNKIGIGANRNRAFAWEETEELRRLCAQRIDEAVNNSSARASRHSYTSG